MTVDLIAYLRARIAEDEAAAQAAAPAPWRYPGIDSISGGMLYDESVAIVSVHWDNVGEKINPAIRKRISPEQADATGRHIARWDPATVFADIALKRSILDAWEDAGREPGPEASYAWVLLRDVVVMPWLRQYAGRDDFNPAWATP